MRYITVKNSQTTQSGRDDARFYLPRSFNKEKYGSLKWCKISDLADTPASSITASRFPDKLFNIFNLEDVDEIEGEIIRIHQIKGKDVKGGKRLLFPNDVIFARIEPSIFNKKYAIVPNDVTECLASTEFLIARPKKGVSSFYLHWALRGHWIAEQLDPGILTGSTGRRRLSPEDFKDLLIPEASSDEQIEFGQNIVKYRALRREYLEKADNMLIELDEKIISDLFESKSFIK